MWIKGTSEIKQNIFLHRYDADNKGSNIVRHGIKSRPFDPDGILKTNKMYEVEASYIKRIGKDYMEKHKTDKLTIDDLPDILGIPNETLVFFRDDENSKYYMYIKDAYHNGWNISGTIRFALLSEMIELKSNPKEKEALAKKQEAEKKLKFNSLVLKDNIIEAFKKAGYSLVSYDNGHTFRIQSPHHNRLGERLPFMNFIEEAIDFYINNNILKDLGCTVHVPEPSSLKKGRQAYDDIISMKDIDLNLEGVNNA